MGFYGCIGKIYIVTRISKVTLHFKTGNMTLQYFAGYYPIVLCVVLIVVWLVAYELGAHVVRKRNKRKRAVGLSCQEIVAYYSERVPNPDLVKRYRTGAMIGDKIATVTRSGKVYTGKCGSHEVVGFSIPEVLHELAEAVNREITANQ